MDMHTERVIIYMLYGQLFLDGKKASIICANKIMIDNGKRINQLIYDNCID